MEPRSTDGGGLTLFTRKNCTGCNELKKLIDLDSVHDLLIHHLPPGNTSEGPGDVEALGEMDWMEIESVPTLVLADHFTKITGPDEIATFLKEWSA